MYFYNIKDDYINYLRTFDNMVAENKSEKRPYVGIVLSIDEIDYFAPFTSPKPKHLKMKNGLYFRKIANGVYGAINLNNMIPVVQSALIPLNISQVRDPKYRRLLQNQYNAIKNDEVNIQNTASKLREALTKKYTNPPVYIVNLKSRCCNLLLLEEKSKLYK